MSTKKPDQLEDSTSIKSITEALNIEELERRLELATQSTDCACGGYANCASYKKE